MTTDEAKNILLLCKPCGNVKTPVSEAVDIAINAINFTEDFISLHATPEKMKVALKLLDVIDYKRMEEELNDIIGENNELY